MPSNWITTNRVMPISIGPYSPQATGWNVFLLGSTAFTGTTIGSSNIFLYPVQVTEPYRVRRFWVVNGATTNGTWEVGVYSDGGAKVASSGAVTQAGGGVIQQSTTDFTLGIGSYWIALASSSGSATFLGRTIAVTSARNLREGTLYAMATTVGSAIPMASQITIGSNMAFNAPVYGIASVAL
jgi:hypothetical protein